MFAGRAGNDKTKFDKNILHHHTENSTWIFFLFNSDWKEEISRGRLLKAINEVHHAADQDGAAL